MPPLIGRLDEACPGFVPSELFADIPYMWMGDFVRHVARRQLAGAEGEVRAVFAIIETEIARAGPDQNLAITGFLEDLQNTNLHPEGSHPSQFETYLGPESRKRWDALNGFWHMVVAIKPKQS